MEESWVDYHFEFNLLPKSDNNVFPIFNHDVLLLDKSQQDHVVAMKKDDDDDSISGSVVLPPPSSEVDKSEGVKPVKYKKSNSTGAWLGRWSSLKSLLRRSNSESGADPRKTNNPEQAGKVFPVFSRDVHLLDKLSQQDHVEAVTKDDGSVSTSVAVPPPSISEVDKPEGVKPVKYMKKSKSTGTTLLRCWSLKGLLRRSNSESGAPRRTNMTEEGKEDSFVFSRSSTFSTKEGEALAWDGCILHLCPCLSSPPVHSPRYPKELADQEEAVVKEKKTSSKSSTGFFDGSKHNNSKVGKGPNNVHEVYLTKDSKSRQASSPYRQHAIVFFPNWSALVRPLEISA